MERIMHAYRSHTCGELRQADVGQTVNFQAGFTAAGTMVESCSLTCEITMV